MNLLSLRLVTSTISLLRKNRLKHQTKINKKITEETETQERK